MPDTRPSPFAGLGTDKALLRSTQRRPDAARQVPDDEVQHDASSARSRRRTAGPDDRTDTRSNERTNVRSRERPRVRHSFDIYQDQLLSLSEIQAAAFKRTGRKPKVGELVQEALDAYIKRIAGRSDE